MTKLIELSAENIQLYLAQLAAIEQEAFAEPWTQQDYLEEAARSISHILALVEGEQDERLVGYAGFWQVFDEADINNVAVVQDKRGQGHGRRLMQGVLAAARRLGCRRLVLEVRPGNAAALALYQSCGFAECGRRRGYYQDNGEDALIMECVNNILD